VILQVQYYSFLAKNSIIVKIYVQLVTSQNSFFSVHMEKVPYNVGKRMYKLTLHVEGNGSMAETLLPEWACFRPGAWPPL
jgi:hypothetical protein